MKKNIVNQLAVLTLADFDALQRRSLDLVDEDEDMFLAWKASMGDAASNVAFIAPDWDWASARKWLALALSSRGEYKEMCLERAHEALRTAPNWCNMGDIRLFPRK